MGRKSSNTDILAKLIIRAKKEGFEDCFKCTYIECINCKDEIKIINKRYYDKKRKGL